MISGGGLEAVGVIGLGYVGLPLAVELADSGRQVVGFDSDTVLVAELEAGHSGIPDVSDDSLVTALANSLRISASSFDLDGCGTFVICVPTPLSASAGADTSSIERAVSTIAPYVRAGTLIVLESTS